LKSKAPIRDHDEVKIPNGKYVELYSPAAGPIASPSLLMPDGTTKRKLQPVRFILSADANVTFKDGSGNAVSAMPLKGGVEYKFLASEISVVSTGNVYIIHDGEIDQTQDLV